MLRDFTHVTWGNEADVLTVSKEKSKGHWFIWSKGLLKLIANGDKRGFPPARRKSVRALQDRAKHIYSSVTYSLETTGLESDDSEEFAMDTAQFSIRTEFLFLHVYPVLFSCCKPILYVFVWNIRDVCGVFFHCNLLVAHDVSLSCYSCSLWLKALTVVPSRCLYCNNFFVVCVCFCFFSSNYTIENWKQCKSGLRFPPETWFCSSASTPFFQTMWTHSVVFNWVYCNLSLLLFILVLSLSQIWLSFWPVLSFSLFFEHSLLSGTVRCSRLI